MMAFSIFNRLLRAIYPRGITLHRLYTTIQISPGITVTKCNDAVSTPLVVLLTWINAKSKICSKYISCWTDHGYNVLLVMTSIKDVCFTKTGCRLKAKTTADYLLNEVHNSVPIIFHGISVGCSLTNTILMDGGVELCNRTTHLIYETYTTYDGIIPTMQRFVLPRYREIATPLIKCMLAFIDDSHHVLGREFFEESKLPIPCYFLHSKADDIAPYHKTKNFIELAKKSAPVEVSLFPRELNIPHAGILKHIEKQSYMNLMMSFIYKYGHDMRRIKEAQ